MPDTFAVDRTGIVVGWERDRKDAFETIHGFDGGHAVIYRGDPHDVISPRRSNPVAKAARARRDAYLASLRNCVNCEIDEEGHTVGWEGELYDERACDDFTAPAPLAVIA